MIETQRSRNLQHSEYCECEHCEGEQRLEYHVPNVCLFDGDQHRYDGGRGATQRMPHGTWGH